MHKVFLFVSSYIPLYLLLIVKNILERCTEGGRFLSLREKWNKAVWFDEVNDWAICVLTVLSLVSFFYLKKNRVKDEYNYIVETICYNELITRGYKVYVGKTYRGEVDFIAQRGQEKIYVQAAYYLADEAVVEREFGAYRAIEDNYPKYVVSMDKVTLGRDGIIHKNLIDFLLER